MNRFRFWARLAVVTAMALFFCVGAVAQERIFVETGVVGDGGDAVGRLDGLLIGIDPGHQARANSDHEPIAPGSKSTKPKVSSGTQGVVSKTPEHAIDLDVSLQLRDALVKEGARVMMTRETADVDISNIERAVMMNEAGADLVLRIHCNGVETRSAHGLALYVRKNGAMAQECDQAARALIARMIEKTGAKDRGIVRNDTYTGLNWSEVPSILVEMGFLTNPEEDELLNSPEYQKKLVEGMVEGIVDYFDRGAPQWPIIQCSDQDALKADRGAGEGEQPGE